MYVYTHTHSAGNSSTIQYDSYLQNFVWWWWKWPGVHLGINLGGGGARLSFCYLKGVTTIKMEKEMSFNYQKNETPKVWTLSATKHYLAITIISH